jgi:hypothetical protein
MKDLSETSASSPRKVTVEVSPYISVRGDFVQNLPDGLVMVASNSRTYIGKPVPEVNTGAGK